MDIAIRRWSCICGRRTLQDNTCQVSLSRAQTLAGYVQFYAFCTVWLDKRTSFEQHYEAALSYFDRQLDKHAGSIVRCRTEADARAAIAGGKCGAFLSIEGAEAISCDPGKLELAYEQGVRMIAPCWNAPNALTGSIVSGGGLTAQGREFVRRAQKLGILLDVSHISEKAFWDLCDITEKPFVASHSNSRAVCRHVRKSHRRAVQSAVPDRRHGRAQPLRRIFEGRWSRDVRGRLAAYRAFPGAGRRGTYRARRRSGWLQRAARGLCRA